MTANHFVDVLDLDGFPRLRIQLKANRNDPSQVFLSAPKFCLLDADAVTELANLLADLLEQIPEPGDR